ncbi:hypothetical protein NL676_015824 [Syzygium grande]|nr:hypothetical protein NL676_015824 [Syzygium grande]
MSEKPFRYEREGDTQLRSINPKNVLQWLTDGSLIEGYPARTASGAFSLIGSEQLNEDDISQALHLLCVCTSSVSPVSANHRAPAPPSPSPACHRVLAQDDDSKLGIKKKIVKLQGSEKAVVARHEAGHAVSPSYDALCQATDGDWRRNQRWQQGRRVLGLAQLIAVPEHAVQGFGSIRMFDSQTMARIRPIRRSFFRSGGDGDLDVAFVLCFPRPKVSKIWPPRKAAARMKKVRNAQSEEVGGFPILRLSE